MPPFSFDSKGIIDAINKAASDIVSNLREVIGGETGTTAESVMSGTVAQINKEFGQITEKYQNIGKIIGESLFNPLKVISKGTGKLMKKTFAGPKAQAMGRFMKNMGSMIGSMLGPIGFILKIFERLGVFEPILEIINDLIEMLGARLIEKMMPSFEKLFDIMLSDEVMTLIDSLADLFIAIIAPLMEVVITLLPVFVAILGPIIRLLSELMPLLMLPSMILAKLIGVLVKLPAFQMIIEGLSGAILIIADVISLVTDFVITTINDFMNLLTGGLWADIPTMGGDLGEMTTTAGGITPSTVPPNVIRGESGTSITINVDGDISSEETMDKILDEIGLRTKLGAFI